VRGKGKGRKWEGHELKKLTGNLRKSEGREEAPAFATVEARWHSGGAAGACRVWGRPEGRGVGPGEIGKRRVERPGAGGGTGDGLERR
jgi:hypothetical protein